MLFGGIRIALTACLAVAARMPDSNEGPSLAVLLPVSKSLTAHTAYVSASVTAPRVPPDHCRLSLAPRQLAKAPSLEYG